MLLHFRKFMRFSETVSKWVFVMLLVLGQRGEVCVEKPIVWPFSRKLYKIQRNYGDFIVSHFHCSCSFARFEWDRQFEKCNLEVGIKC